MFPLVQHEAAAAAEAVGSLPELPIPPGLAELVERDAHTVSSRLADGFAADAFRLAGVELLVGLAWFAAALFGFKVFVEGARRDGSIDLTE